VAGAAPVVRHDGGEPRNLLLDKQIVQTGQAGTRQDDNGRAAAARPVQENAAAVDLPEPADRCGEPAGEAMFFVITAGSDPDARSRSTPCAACGDRRFTFAG
jgi:hypothetical protein